MRLSYGRDTYLEHLPAVYGRDPDGRDFLERVLTLFESVLGRLEGQIDDLPRLFSADAAPHGGPPSWLAWLAGWLSFELAETWTEGAARSALAEAVGLQARRGTVEALRRYAKLYAGVEARILEPGVHAPVWMLGESSSLGVTTALAPGPPQGAVLGSTAALDASHLTRNEDFGAPLFEDLAHRFCVQIHCAELFRPGALDALRAILDRERPAHTVYHLCVLEPRMRVGSQATVGVDAVVAEAPTVRLASRLGGTVLARTATPCVAPSAITGASPCPPDATEA
jgi:phage tail-like protein